MCNIPYNGHWVFPGTISYNVGIWVYRALLWYDRKCIYDNVQ